MASGSSPQHCQPALDPWTWRGPGLAFQSTLQMNAEKIYQRKLMEGECHSPQNSEAFPGPVSSQGYRNDLARARNMGYTAVHICECEESREDMDCFGLNKQGYIKVDIEKHVLPLLSVYVQEYLLRMNLV